MIAIPFTVALYLYSAFMPFDIMKLFFNGGMSAFARKASIPNAGFMIDKCKTGQHIDSIAADDLEVVALAVLSHKVGGRFDDAAGEALLLDGVYEQGPLFDVAAHLVDRAAPNPAAEIRLKFFGVVDAWAVDAGLA